MQMTIDEFQQEVYMLTQKERQTDFLEHLEGLFNDVQQLLIANNISSKDSISISTEEIQKVRPVFNNVKRHIMNVVRRGWSGGMLNAQVLFTNWWFSANMPSCFEIMDEPIEFSAASRGFLRYCNRYILRHDQTIYRCRLLDSPIMNLQRKDFLHMPYNLRGKVKSYRFSMAGCPALYCASSIFCCWKELRMPYVHRIAAVGIEPQDIDNILDLRIFQQIRNKETFNRYVAMLPLIISCSLRNQGENDRFNPEYIIPQIVMHTLVNKNNNLNGIVHNSTQTDIIQPDDMENYVFLANPDLTLEDKYDSEMVEKFKLSEPIFSVNIVPNYEDYEQNKQEQKYSEFVCSILENEVNNSKNYMKCEF